MNLFDKWLEAASRGIARRSSRRSFLAAIGGTLIGGVSLPLLPVARAAGGHGGSGYPGVGPQPTGDAADPGDRASCDYWRYCGMDGFLCTCCGGTHLSCPPGTDMAPMTWVGTCRNAADGKDYIISYNDCCGKTSCGRCLCNRNESDKPTYRAFANNDTNWCLGTDSTTYHCTTAVILGVAPGR
jgi:methylamine dehydrogenase light chain